MSVCQLLRSQQSHNQELISFALDWLILRSSKPSQVVYAAESN